MNKKIKIVSLLLPAFSIISAVSCNGGGGKYKKPTIASVMCNPDLDRFQRASKEVEKSVKKLGYESDAVLKSGQKDINAWTNVAISKGAKAIIMAPSDSNAASTIVNKAYKNHIPFVDYDKLITGTDKYDYYATFNNAKIGKLEAYGVALQVFGLNVNNDGIIVKKSGEKFDTNVSIMTAEDDAIIALIKKQNQDKSKEYKIGWLGGSDSDNNAKVIYEAQKPFMEKLYNIPNVSKAWENTEFGKIAVPKWSLAIAKTKVESFLTKMGDVKKLSGIVCANDSTALGAVQAVLGKLANDKGYIKNIFISGQDAGKKNIESIKNGGQSFTISKPDTLLAPIATLIADNLIKKPNIKLDELNKNIIKYIKENKLKINFVIDAKSYESTPGHAINTFLVTPKPITTLTSEIKAIY